ncbi:MAG: hypothetical protein ACREVZ_07250, partial [Burkholderiales bacterium]
MQSATAEIEAQEPQPKEERPPRWFFDLIADIPKDDWGRIWHIEVHRLEPKVPGVPGSKGYLDLYLEPITMNAVQKRFGGGKFQLNLCKNGKWHNSHTFDVEGQPIYDLSRERPNGQTGLLPSAGGEAFAKQVIDMLRDELTRSREAGQTPSGAITDETIGLVTKAAENAMQMIRNQVPAATEPTALLSAMVTTLKNLGLIGQPPAVPGGGIVETISVLKTLGLIGQPAPDPMAQITMFLTIFEKLDALRGPAAGGAPRDWKATLAEKAIEHVPEILREVRATAEASREAAGQRLEAARTNERVATTIRSLPARPGA